MIIVLIAVALFAAITYAMTQGSRGSQSAMTSEEARITASDIVQYGNSLRPIADKMLLMNGLLDTNTPAGSGILFDAPGTFSSPSPQEVFDSAGGNAPYATPPPQACNSTCAYVFSGQYTLTGVGSGTNPELAMLLVDIPQQVCAMVNNILGLGSAIPAGSALTTAEAFTGTNYGSSSGDAITLATASHALCYQESSGTGRYIYVNVIRAR